MLSASTYTPNQLLQPGGLPKPKRGKRHDLSHLNEEEKAERRREQSREYGRMMRERLDGQMMELEREKRTSL